MVIWIDHNCTLGKHSGLWGDFESSIKELCVFLWFPFHPELERVVSAVCYQPTFVTTQSHPHCDGSPAVFSKHQLSGSLFSLLRCFFAEFNSFFSVHLSRCRSED